MDSLPPELISNIANFLLVDKRWAYATISKSWQAVIEAHTFKSLVVQHSDAAVFRDILRTTARRCALAQLQWNITLSESNTKAITITERRNNEAEELTESITTLLNELARWEHEYSSFEAAPALRIIITVADSSSEDAACDQVDHSPLVLHHDGDLPQISRFADVSHASISPRIIDGPSIARIASAFRKIRCLDVRIYDDELSDLDVRRQQRRDTAKNLSNISLADLIDLRLEIMHSPTLNENFQIQSALPSPESPDHLSETIHALSLAPNLKKMYVNGFAVISSALFWPVLEVKTEPHWPNLEWYEVTFDMKTPDGEWYLLPGIQDESAGSDEDEESDESMSDEEEDDDERAARALAISTGQYPDNPTRGIPNALFLHPFFLSAAHAASRMLKLRYMSLRMRFTNPMRAPCEMVFAGPGVPHWHDEKVVDEETSVEEVREGWRMYWNVRGLGMQEEFEAIWKCIEEERGIEIRVVDLSGKNG